MVSVDRVALRGRIQQLLLLMAEEPVSANARLSSNHNDDDTDVFDRLPHNAASVTRQRNIDDDMDFDVQRKVESNPAEKTLGRNAAGLM